MCNLLASAHSALVHQLGGRDEQETRLFRGLPAEQRGLGAERRTPSAYLGPAPKVRRTRWNGRRAGAFAGQLVRMRTVRSWIVPDKVITMNDIIYLVGLIVVVMFILSVLGIH
jgi:hypothetical protein